MSGFDPDNQPSFTRHVDGNATWVEPHWPRGFEGPTVLVSTDLLYEMMQNAEPLVVFKREGKP